MGNAGHTNSRMGRIVAIDEHRGVVGGVRMRWLDTGSVDPAVDPGPSVPAVLIHGIPTSAELWRHVLPALETRAIAWEMVGYGASIPAGRGRDISVARQAGYLRSWLRAMGIERAVLVGHDLGGGVIQRVAVEDRELCAGLVMTNAIAYDSWPVWPMRLARRLHWLVRRLPDVVMSRGFEAVLRRMHSPSEIGKESARVHWGHYARYGGAEAFVRQARSLDTRDTLELADRLPRLDLPARVVWGASDPFQSIEWGRRLARDLGTDVRAIDDGLHFTPEDHPEVVADAIASLIRAV